MTATPQRIGFVIEPYRRAVSETPAVASRYGNLARESADPLDTWFSALPDAQRRADERQTLLGPDRRRFSQNFLDVEAVLDLLDADEMTTVRFIDEERGIDQSMLLTDIVIDTEAHAAPFKVWG